MREFGLFLRSVRRHWVFLMTGIASVALGAITSIWSGPSSGWAFWVIAFVCLIVSVFMAWRDEHRGREQAEEKLRPKLAIGGVPETHDSHLLRIRVSNMSDASCTFGVNLIAARPPIEGVALPYPLHITHS